MIRILSVVLLGLLSVNPVFAEEFYFATTLGTGTDTDKFRPGCPADAAAIDLRGPTGKDLWVCRSASRTGATNAIPLATTAKEVMPGRAAIALALGKGIKASSQTVPELLRELLADSGALKAGSDGKYKIYLGGPDPIWEATQITYDLFRLNDNGLFADLWNSVETHVAYAATLAVETFTNTDGDLAGRTHVHPWSEPIGTGWVILTNKAENTTGGGTQLGRLDTSLDTDNFFVRATLSTLSRTGGGFARCGVAGRKDNTATATFYRYQAEKVAAIWELDRVNAGASTSIGTSATAPVDGDLMELVMDGSTITGKANGVTLIGPTTDGSPITGNKFAGLYSNKSTTTMICDIDDLLTADLSTNVYRRRGY